MAAAAKKPLTKTQIISELAERCELSKTDVSNVLEEIEALIADALSKKGSGAFTFPSLFKIVKKEKPARPKRKGRNPATGEEIWISAKPKSEVVKLTALKKLKEMI